MLYKKIKRLLITVLATMVIASSIFGAFSIHQRFNNKSQIEYKVDMTEFKIKQVINTNKLQTLEVEFTVSVDDYEYDKSKIKMLDGLSKALTTRKLTVTGCYNAIFTYDMSKCNITNNSDGTYTITINSSDVEVNIVTLGEAKVNENMSVLGRYYSAKDTSRVINQLNEMAKKQVYTQENINTTVDNAINNLTKLFQNVGVDTSKVYFVKQFSGMGVDVK